MRAKVACCTLALCCALSLLAGCSSQLPAASAPLPESSSPEGSAPPVDSAMLPVSGSPVSQPDEETTLTYKPGSEYITVDALRHHSLHGYSIVYVPGLYSCQSFGNGESYWASAGNYMSVSRISGMSAKSVAEGLRLQENIEAEAVQADDIGGHPVYTLEALAQNHLDRRFYVVDCGSDTLLVEMSVDSTGENAQTYLASQYAMLATLTLQD